VRPGHPVEPSGTVPRRTPFRRIRHMKTTRTLRRSLAYFFCRALLFCLACLPRSAGQLLGRLCGLLFYAISPRHRSIARANLGLAFGDTLTPSRRARLARASFAHAGMILADAAYFPRTARRPLDEVAVYEGREHLLSAASEGRGVLVFSGHFGHWELVALLQARIGVPFTMVVRPLDNARLNDYLTRLRGITGNEVIAKYDAARAVLRALRSGRAVALLIDQNVRGEGGLFVDFFGKAASTTPALATFAFKCQAPMVPVFSYPMPDGRLLIRYGPPLRAERRGTIADDILDLTRRCTSILEAEIRRHPEFWLWMHNRWRTRPPEASGHATGRDERTRGALMGSLP
jgi:Kdo2-lipid IVA lauroyltransferase/acyltransferase